MKFRAKLILLYSIFVVAVGLVVGWYQNISQEKAFYTQEGYSADISTSVRMQEFSDALKSMNQVMKYVFADDSILNDLKDYYADTGDGLLSAETYQNINNIEKMLSSDFVSSSVYRVIFFNDRHMAAASDNYGKTTVRDRVSLDEIPCADRAEAEPGTNVVAAVHEDEWGRYEQPQVISLVKCLRGEEYGFVEVQFLAENIWTGDKGAWDYYIQDDAGGFLYGTDAETELDTFSNAVKETNRLYHYGGQLIYSLKNDDYGFRILSATSDSYLRSANRRILQNTIMTSGIFIVLGILFVILASNALTRPMDQMKKILDDTDTNNLPGQMGAPVSGDELQGFMESYQNLLQRLKMTMDREKELSNLNLQSQFDMLQAQVNPHFLYNTLNVISTRGMLDGDEEICEICGNLASMLRYSTDTSEKTTLIRNELDYVRQYIYLMKARYQDKLQFTEDVEQEVLGEKIPRAVLQQLVENSIQHGKRGNAGVLQITLTMRKSEGGWHAVIRDNGEGFDSRSLHEITGQFENIRSKIGESGRLYPDKIGGIGLANIYARMTLLYEERFHMKVSNDNGAVVSMWVQEDFGDDKES